MEVCIDIEKNLGHVPCTEDGDNRRRFLSEFTAVLLKLGTEHTHTGFTLTAIVQTIMREGSMVWFGSRFIPTSSRQHMQVQCYMRYKQLVEYMRYKQLVEYMRYKQLVEYMRYKQLVEYMRYKQLVEYMHTNSWWSTCIQTAGGVHAYKQLVEACTCVFLSLFGNCPT